MASSDSLSSVIWVVTLAAERRGRVDLAGRVRFCLPQLRWWLVSAFLTSKPRSHFSQTNGNGMVAFIVDWHLWPAALTPSVASHFLQTLGVSVIVVPCTEARCRMKLRLMSLQDFPWNVTGHPGSVHSWMFEGGCVTVRMLPSKVIHWFVLSFRVGVGASRVVLRVLGPAPPDILAARIPILVK